MEKQFVTYNIALKLKELGFDEECLAYYGNNILVFNKHEYLECDKNQEIILAPLWQQAIDWLREKYNLYINVEPKFTKDWEFLIFNLNDGLLFGSSSLYFQKELDYYRAREQAILKTIELCKK